jgi:hypothetical protein
MVFECGGSARILGVAVLVLATAVGVCGQIKKGGGRIPYCSETVRPQVPVCMKAGYSKMVRPTLSNVTVIFVDFRFNDIEEVNDEHQTITVHAHMVIKWEDNVRWKNGVVPRKI